MNSITSELVKIEAEIEVIKINETIVGITIPHTEALNQRILMKRSWGTAHLDRDNPKIDIKDFFYLGRLEQNNSLANFAETLEKHWEETKKEENRNKGE